jgi:host factor-I protein
MEVCRMFMEKNTNVQDEYIEELKRKGATVTVFLTRGNRITGKVLDHDKYTLLLEVEGEPNLIYKHAISTIVQGG